MGSSTNLKNGLLQLLLQNANFANIGDATGLRGSSTAGSIYVGLYTADPGAGGNQNTNEISFTGYARIASPRDNTDWSVSGGVASNLLELDFGVCTAGGPVTANYVALGTASSGTGVLLISGALTTPKTINNGDTARFAIGALTWTVT